ncbi:ATP-grasp domain-containing protein [Demequina aurantiaca]|uniref:ATP-grasp domain-containing protein n=1 Tax=Demequina aurantiaca TaxID=676200 RepID=UPI003D34F9EB
MNPRIALVTTRDLPVPDADEVMLLPHLPEAELVCWDDPDVDWANYEAVVIRSTWNYHDNLDAFLLWAERVSHVTSLYNSLETIKWNTDKRYLADLAGRGFPVVPTTFVDPGEEIPDDVVVPLDGHLVVKPSVGAGSNGAKLFNGDEAAARAHLASLHAAGKTAMIQPYLSQIDEVGETALMYVGGQFSHAARKAAILSRNMSWETGIYADEKVTGTHPSAAERELADRIVESLPALAYTRVDLLPTPDGPVVLELELTEPSLFLGLSEGAPERAAAAFRALLD